jgi:hypothetical protein
VDRLTRPARQDDTKGKQMKKLVLAAALGAVTIIAFIQSPDAETAPTAAGGLRPAAAFAGIANPAQRSAALFQEAGKVIQNPRCMNCHPAGDRPLQGDDSHLHIPAVQRGAGNIGVPGLYCTTCHQQANYDAVGIPGHPQWSLAPIEMAWQGKSLAEICTQIKDPARNGGRSMADLVHHMAEDSLVGWGWHPDVGRTPVPGSQQVFGELIKAWADTGAVCPEG